MVDEMPIMARLFHHPRTERSNEPHTITTRAGPGEYESTCQTIQVAQVFRGIGRSIIAAAPPMPRLLSLTSLHPSYILDAIPALKNDNELSAGRSSDQTVRHTPLNRTLMLQKLQRLRQPSLYALDVQRHADRLLSVALNIRPQYLGSF